MFNKLKYQWLLFKANYLLCIYKFNHWLFKWNQDEEGDLVFSIANIVHFVKYKEHTILKFGKQDYINAPKYIR